MKKSGAKGKALRDFLKATAIASDDDFAKIQIEFVNKVLQGHQDPPRISFFIFSRLQPLKNENGAFLGWAARPAGMWGCLDLDHALEAATRQYPEGEPILLRLDMVLPSPP